MMKKYIIYITLIIIGMFVGYVIRPENKIEDVLCKTETSDVELVSYIDATYDLNYYINSIDDYHFEMKFNIEDNGIMYTGKAFYALVTLDSALPSNIDFNADNVFKIEIDEDTGHVSRMPIYVVDENYAFDEFSKTELARFINKEIDKIDLKLVIYTDYGEIKYVATSILTN